jgi:hypothetical protein
VKTQVKLGYTLSIGGEWTPSGKRKEVMDTITLEMDLLYEDFTSDELVRGKDVTSNHLFQPDGPLFLPPGLAKATVHDPEGPGGGNPVIRIQFSHEEDAETWYEDFYLPLMEDAGLDYDQLVRNV